MSASPTSARIDHAVTSGTFELDGGSWEVDNNVWLVGDDDEVVVIDAPHDVDTIVDAIGGRRVTAVVLTHGHNDHVNSAPALADATGAPLWFPPDDRMLWDDLHERAPDEDLVDGTEITVAGVTLRALRTPGHSPGSTCLYSADLGAVFSGDTLFAGGPGATGRSFSSFGQIIDSIRDRLFTLPADTRVHTGHGDTTTIGEESPHLEEWVARGH